MLDGVADWGNLNLVPFPKETVTLSLHYPIGDFNFKLNFI